MWWLILIIILIIIIIFRKDKSIVEEIPNFLTHEQCDEIIRLSESNLTESKVYSKNTDDIRKNDRISSQAWFSNDIAIVNEISEKCAKITKTRKSFQEHLQVVKYTEGGFFNPHFDPCVGDEKFCERMNKGSGHRRYTVLIYLNDDLEGGETVFPELGISIKPEKGKAVVFKNVDDNGNIIQRSKHGGNPVLKGEKWICNKWIHFKDFE